MSLGPRCPDTDVDRHVSLDMGLYCNPRRSMPLPQEYINTQRRVAIAPRAIKSTWRRRMMLRVMILDIDIDQEQATKKV